MNTFCHDTSQRKIKGYEAAWSEVAKTIAQKGFHGLQTTCPVCLRKGTVLSKWIAKTPIKPLYIIHCNGNGHFKACPLDKDQAAKIRKRIRLTYTDVRKALSIGTVFVLFSGGKDSLCVLEYLRKLCRNAKKNFTVLHADTTAGFPEIEDYINVVCRKLEVPLVTVQPPRNFFDLSKRWGIPGVKSRWCCETLKIAPIRRYLSEIDGPKVIFDGIRAAESNIRATYVPIWYHPSFRCINVSPIFNWSDRAVDDYIKRNNLPKSPGADLGTSAECWCGAYKCKSDFETLLEVHPEIFDKLVEVEKAQLGKYTFIYEKGKQIGLSTLKQEAKM